MAPAPKQPTEPPPLSECREEPVSGSEWSDSGSEWSDPDSDNSDGDDEII